MIWRYRDGHIPSAGSAAAGAEELEQAARQAPGLIDTALAGFDFRRATSALWSIVDEANRYINHIRPWELASAERDGDQPSGQRLDAVLATLIQACRTIADHLAPFLPDAATRITQQCAAPDGRLPAPHLSSKGSLWITTKPISAGTSNISSARAGDRSTGHHAQFSRGILRVREVAQCPVRPRPRTCAPRRAGGPGSTPSARVSTQMGCGFARRAVDRGRCQERSATGRSGGCFQGVLPSSLVSHCGGLVPVSHAGC